MTLLQVPGYFSALHRCRRVLRWPGAQASRIPLLARRSAHEGQARGRGHAALG